MPNHVTNIIKASPEVLKAGLNQDGNFDFTAIIPRHEDLELNGADGVDCAAEDAARFMCKEKPDDNELVARLQMYNRLRTTALDMNDKQFEQFVLMMRNKRKHGFYHMMDYARRAWGTKWNAYNQSVEKIENGEVSFETAWNHPELVLSALSKRFSEETIHVLYADEDTGSNCGEYTIKNGEVLTSNIAPPWSEQSDSDKRKWTEFAFKLRYGDEDRRSFGYDENWKYSDDVYDAWEQEQSKEA